MFLLNSEAITCILKSHEGARTVSEIGFVNTCISLSYSRTSSMVMPYQSSIQAKAWR